MRSGADNRTEGRSNVFLTAVLETETASLPVRIRNISPGGALIEGEKLPAIGSKVRLMRGGLTATGFLSWEGNGHAGLNFDARVDVQTWVQRVGHAGQQHVDGIVEAIRRAEPVQNLGHKPKTNSLVALSVALDELCNRFASSDEFPLEFGEDLLKLDALAQSLRELARRPKA